MKDLIDTAAEIQESFEEFGWKFCFIGGLAVQHWGEPRLTRDIDISLLTGFGAEESFLDVLFATFQPRIDECRDFALRNRVVLMRSDSQVGIDIALAGLPFEELMIERAGNVSILPGTSLRLCSAEDLIVLKAFASRAVDWHDVESIVIRQGVRTLDWEHIDRQLQPLAEAKDDLEILRKLETIRLGCSK